MDIKKLIREEIEDFDWAINSDPRGTIPQVGDRVVVHNMGDEQAFLRWLGGFAPDYIKGKFGKNIIGDIVEIMDDRHILLKEYYTKQKIWFPTYKFMEYLKNNKVDYKNLDMIYVKE